MSRGLSHECGSSFLSGGGQLSSVQGVVTDWAFTLVPDRVR